MLEEADDVIVFGSRAAGVHSRLSDLDIQCVGARRRYKSERLDIVSLASHILAYGVTIRGHADWKDAVRLSESAVSRKEGRLIALVDGLWAYWDRLHPDFRRKYMTTIRREVQRLQLLIENIAVPATPVLDGNWKNEADASDKWAKCFQGIKTDNMATRDRLLRTTDLIRRYSLLRGAPGEKNGHGSQCFTHFRFSQAFRAHCELSKRHQPDAESENVKATFEKAPNTNAGQTPSVLPIVMFQSRQRLGRYCAAAGDGPGLPTVPRSTFVALPCFSRSRAPVSASVIM